MKKKTSHLIGRIMAALLAVILLMMPLSAWADSEVFAHWGLTPVDGAYTGSIRVSVSHTEGEGSDKQTFAVEGMRYTVYQVWQLEEDGSLTFKAPFTDPGTISDEMTAEASRQATEAFASTAKAGGADVYAADVTTTAEGIATLTGVPYGGYLFVPAGTVMQGAREFTTTTFLVSVPMKDPVSGQYTADVDATAKTVTTSELIPQVKILKVDEKGEPLRGARLRVYNAADETIDTWVSQLEAHELQLDPGVYKLSELNAPDDYLASKDVFFRVNADGTVDIVSDINGTSIVDNAVKRDGVSIFGRTLRNGEGVDTVYLVNEPVKPDEPPIEKEVLTSQTNGEWEKPHGDLASKEEIYSYRIKTRMPVDGAGRTIETFVVTDVLEPVLERPATTALEELVRVIVGSYTLTAEDINKNVIYAERDGRYTLQVDMTDYCRDYQDEDVEIVFSAKIRAGADLSSYRDTTTGRPLVPNTASYKINNGPDVRSNTVTVTPPDEPTGVNPATETPYVTPEEPDRPGTQRTSRWTESERTTSTATNATTGDTNKPLMWGIIAGAAALILIIAVVVSKKRKKKDE